MGALEKQNLVALVTGILFACGLVISGMTQPHIVLGFLDIQEWNPTLLFVMGAALLIHIPAYLLLRQKKTPFFDRKWHLPPHRKIDWRLIFGSALFGIGWGITGYCPGPALTALPSSPMELGGVVLMIIAGLKFANIVNAKGRKK